MIQDTTQNDNFRDAPIYNLYVYPTYTVKMKQRPSFKPSEEAIKKANEARANMREQSEKFFQETGQLPPVLSPKARRRLTNAVNWLVASAKTKRVYSKKTGAQFSFKVSFVTLTLPTVKHDLSDAVFKNKLLHTFISNARNKWGMHNFVWKVETQKNGNIHCHLTTDVYIQWHELRSTWNKILSSYGLIDSYREKHSKMTFEEYCKSYNYDNSKTTEQMRFAYDQGVKSGWTNPNTTDVHAVHKVKDIGAYLAKYFDKEEEGRRRISGRVWSCSYSLSSKNKLVVECYGTVAKGTASELLHPDIKQKEIIQTNKLTGSQRVVGVIYFHKLSQWGTVIKNELLQEFNRFRFAIRNNLPNDFLVFNTLPEVDEVNSAEGIIDLSIYQPIPIKN